MSGYVRNNGSEPFFIAQRRMYQGSKVSFEDLLKIFSRKSGFKELEPGEEIDPGFVLWLKENIFTAPCWEFCNSDNLPFVFSTDNKKNAVVKTTTKRRRRSVIKEVAADSNNQEEVEAPAKGAGQVLRRKSDIIKGLKITADVIIGADYPEAKNLINQCKNKAELKRALYLSKQLFDKGKHMEHLMRRVEEVTR